MTENNIFSELWKVALTMIEYISKLMDWLFAPLKLSIDIPVKIPLILENGISWSWNIGVAPIALLGVGMVVLVVYWVVLK